MKRNTRDYGKDADADMDIRPVAPSDRERESGYSFLKGEMGGKVKQRQRDPMFVKKEMDMDASSAVDIEQRVRPDLE